MDKRIVIKNSFLAVEISTLGAELKSIKDSSLQEHLWQCDGDSWKGQAPLLFPVCGRLIDGEYTFGGKTYKLDAHGFARKKEFVCEKSGDISAVFLLVSDDDTREVYPFDFELRVTYSLENNSIVITHNIINKTDGEMYFSIGTHEGYSCKGATEDYGIVIDGYDEIENSLLEGPFINGKSEIIKLKDFTLWPTDEDFKKLDTFIFCNIKTKHVKLISRKNERVIRVDYPDFDHLMIWKSPGAEFFCIEPWNGVPDHFGKKVDLCNKPGIMRLEKDGAYNCTHTITIN